MSDSDKRLQLWIDQSSVEAPKVRVAATKTMQQGLIATATIYEGERIMIIPSSSLISEDMIQRRGDSMLRHEDEHDSLRSADAETLEQWTIGMIEEIRRSLLQENSILYIAAHQVQYNWREDDAVALFLIAGRHILEKTDQSAKPGEKRVVGDSETSDGAQALQVAETVQEPPLIEVAPQRAAESVSVILEDGVLQALVVDGAQVEAQTNQLPELQSETSFLEHISRLPQAFPNSPLYFSDEGLTKIEGTNCHGFATRMKQQMDSDYSKIAQVLTIYNKMPSRKMRCRSCQECTDDVCWCHVLDPDRIITLASYKWALCNIYSRSTDFEWNTGSSQASHRRVIAPLFDMMNHDFSSDVTHAMDNKGNLSVFNGSKVIQPMDEIFLNYGSFPNEKLLLVYGFCVLQNPVDAVQIYAPLSPADPLFQVKARILASRCGILDVNAPHLLSRSAGNATIVPPSLLAVLRLTGVQSMEEIRMIANQEEGTIGIIGVHNEASALQALQHALYSMARQLALNMIGDDNLHAASNGVTENSIETNSAKTQSGDDDKATIREANARNSKILCQSEYAILQGAMHELSQRLDALEKGMEGYQ